MPTTSDVVLVLVAIIGLISAVSSQRSASKASNISARTQAETDAYTRARKMDTETISRQEAEIRELREKNHHLRNVEEDNQTLKDEVERLKRRVKDLENAQGMSDSDEEGGYYG